MPDTLSCVTEAPSLSHDGLVLEVCADGKPIGHSASGSFVLKPNSRGHFRLGSCHAKGAGEDKIIWDATHRSVTIESANGLPYPLFYGTAGGSLIIGRSIPAVRNRLRELGTSAPLDPVGAGLMFCMDGLVCGHTPYKAVRATKMNERLVFNLPYGRPVTSTSWQPHYDREDLRDLNFDEAVDGFCGHFEDLRFPDGPLLIPLSGGLDSRLLVALAHRAGHDVHSYTFRRGPSFEAQCARQVADALGTRHTDIDLADECYDSFADRMALETGGAMTGMHTHGYYAVSTLSAFERSLPRIFGYCGDPIGGDYEQNTTVEQSYDSLVDKMIYQNSGSWKLVSAQNKALFRTLLEEEMSGFGVAPSRRLETLVFITRQQALTTHIFDLHARDADVHRPYLDDALIAYGMGLPAAYRVRRKAFFEACLKMFPTVFSLPTTRLPDGFMAWDRQTRMFLSRGMQYATWQVFGHRHAWKSAYTYEHHKNLIAGPLREKFLAALKQVCDFLDVPPVTVNFSRRGIFSGTAFRIMALATLIGEG